MKRSGPERRTPLIRKPPRKRADGKSMCVWRKCRRARWDGTKLCAKHEADRVFSLRIRARDGRCTAQGTDKVECRGVLQAAHIVSRGYMALRWDDSNCTTLCAAHHMFYTDRHLEWEDWVRARGIDWDNLKYLALHDPPMDPEEWLSE